MLKSSKKPNILILGGTGYIGSVFNAKLPDAYTTSLSRYNYLDKDKLHTLVQNGFTHVINCAGYTGKPNVDACESQKADCLYSNATWAGYLAEMCAEQNVILGHVSSGCIYSGCKPDGSGFTEEDAPNFAFNTPIKSSWYSGTKALGEELIKQYPGHYIWRLRIPFNDDQTNPRNYLVKLLTYRTLLEATNSISHIGEFVNACLESFDKCPPGIYNITNPIPVTSKKVTNILAKQLELDEKQFKFFESDDAFNKTVIAPRSNCVLDSTKIMSYGINLTPSYGMIKEVIADWE